MRWSNHYPKFVIFYNPTCLKQENLHLAFPLPAYQILGLITKLSKTPIWKLIAYIAINLFKILPIQIKFPQNITFFFFFFFEKLLQCGNLLINGRCKLIVMLGVSGTLNVITMPHYCSKLESFSLDYSYLLFLSHFLV